MVRPRCLFLRGKPKSPRTPLGELEHVNYIPFNDVTTPIKEAVATANYRPI